MNHRDHCFAPSLLFIAILFLVELPLWAVAQTQMPLPKPRPPANRGFVIITPRRFDAELKPYVEYRRHSLPVEVAVLETVLAKTPGVDDPEKLKRFLYAAWQSRKAHYVLLVGDATVLPVRYMVLDRVTPPAFDTAFYPSDLYYADVYVDVHGVQHKGTNAGEVFHSPPPPPAAYQTGRYGSIGLGRQLVRGGPDGAVAYYGCNTGGQGCGVTLLEGFVRAWGENPQPRLGDCWIGAVRYYYDKEKMATLKPNADWYPPSIFFQGMKYMLFGDPCLQLPR